MRGSYAHAHLPGATVTRSTLAPMVLSSALLVLGCGQPPAAEAPQSADAASVPTSAESTPQRPRRTGPPAEEALDCAGFDFAPDDGNLRCAASEVVDGVAIEKHWKKVPPRKPQYNTVWGVEWTLLLRDEDGWKRYALTKAFCGGEVPAGCSHDEMFRRRFDIARDGHRIAALAPPVYEVEGVIPMNNDAAALAYVIEGAPPYVYGTEGAAENALALLALAPLDLKGAYRETLARGTPIEHAIAASDAGIAGPREVLTELLRNEIQPGTARCRPLSDALDTRPDDPWVAEALATPACQGG